MAASTSIIPTVCTVFTITFDWGRSPRWVGQYLRLKVLKWGANLDVDAPNCDRLRAFRLCRRFALPGTPF